MVTDRSTMLELSVLGDLLLDVGGYKVEGPGRLLGAGGGPCPGDGRRFFNGVHDCIISGDIFIKEFKNKLLTFSHQ